MRKSIPAAWAFAVGCIAATGGTAAACDQAARSTMQQSGASWMLAADTGASGSGKAGTATPKASGSHPGMTGTAPHAQTGTGSASPSDQPVPSLESAQPTEDPSGKREGGGDMGATEESNTSPQEGKTGEKPAP